MQPIEFSLVSASGGRLHGAAWVPARARAMVCLIHGLGEHVGRYQHVADFLNQQGFALYAYDQKGHGRSEGKRGHARLNYLLEDVETLLKFTRSENLESPMFLYGHSWGGNVVANFITSRRISELQGAVLSSPWLQLSFTPPTWKLTLGRLMAQLLPSFTQPNGLEVEQLSRDQAVGKNYLLDPLVHDRISAGLFKDTYESGLQILQATTPVTLPLLVMHGTDDAITSPTASAEFAKKAGPRVTLKLWEGMRHETHNELGKEEVLNFVVDWLQRQLD